MNRFKRQIRLAIGLLLILAVALPSVNLAGAQDGENVLYISVMGQDDIPTLDPSLAEDVNGIQSIRMLFPGLTTLNETTIEVEPGIATWEVSEDGTVYTFSIIPEISWVRYNAETGAVEQVTDESGNPLYVTAQDVVYGWQRSMTPTTLSYYGNVLANWVVGGSAMLETAQRDAEGNVTGVDEAALEAAKAGLGVTAVDEYTVQVTAPGNFSFLPNIYGMWMAVAQPQAVIEEFGDAWFEAENIVSYGPFALKEWLHDESVTFIKNPFWAGTDTIPAPQLDEVTNYFLELPAALANFEAGELDYITPVNPTDLDRIRVEYPDQFFVQPGASTYTFTFNMEKAPFDNVHARRAFSLALDRSAIVQAVTRGDEVPAAFFTNPAVVAAPLQEDYPEVAILLDPGQARIDAAQAEWQLYLDEIGGAENVPPITYVTNDNTRHIAIAEASQQMWRDVLGVEVDLQTLEFGTFLDLRENDAPQLFRFGWIYDYPDANNWGFDVFRSDAGSSADGGNEGHFVNEEFDRLVIEAQSISDPAERAALYGQAELILVWEDVATIPIYYTTTLILRADYVEGPLTNIGLDSFEKWSLNN